MGMTTFFPLHRRLLLLAAFGLGAALRGAGTAPSLPGPETETVLSTYHVRSGQEQPFLAAANRAWALYRRLDAVLPRPHLLAKRVEDAGDLVYVEVFTWRSADIPDHAPAEIKAVWKELEALCRRPDGKSGIEYAELTLASSE